MENMKDDNNFNDAYGKCLSARGYDNTNEFSPFKKD
jgi:hypothetical protein